MAGTEPTYSYRRVYRALCQRKTPTGRERVRRPMGELGLRPTPLIEKKRPAAALAERDWPEGRRLQIDATRFCLDDGIV